MEPNNNEGQMGKIQEKVIREEAIHSLLGDRDPNVPMQDPVNQILLQEILKRPIKETQPEDLADKKEKGEILRKAKAIQKWLTEQGAQPSGETAESVDVNGRVSVDDNFWFATEPETAKRYEYSVSPVWLYSEAGLIENTKARVSLGYDGSYQLELESRETPEDKYQFRYNSSIKSFDSLAKNEAVIIKSVLDDFIGARQIEVPEPSALEKQPPEDNQITYKKGAFGEKFIEDVTDELTQIRTIRQIIPRFNTKLRLDIVPNRNQARELEQITRKGGAVDETANIVRKEGEYIKRIHAKRWIDGKRIIPTFIDISYEDTDSESIDPGLFNIDYQKPPLCKIGYNDFGKVERVVFLDQGERSEEEIRVDRISDEAAVKEFADIAIYFGSKTPFAIVGEHAGDELGQEKEAGIELEGFIEAVWQMEEWADEVKEEAVDLIREKTKEALDTAGNVPTDAKALLEIKTTSLLPKDFPSLNEARKTVAAKEAIGQAARSLLNSYFANLRRVDKIEVVFDDFSDDGSTFAVYVREPDSETWDDSKEDFNRGNTYFVKDITRVGEAVVYQGRTLLIEQGTSDQRARVIMRKSSDEERIIEFDKNINWRTFSKSFIDKNTGWELEGLVGNTVFT